MSGRHKYILARNYVEIIIVIVCMCLSNRRCNRNFYGENAVDNLHLKRACISKFIDKKMVDHPRNREIFWIWLLMHSLKSMSSAINQFWLIRGQFNCSSRYKTIGVSSHCIFKTSLVVSIFSRIALFSAKHISHHFTSVVFHIFQDHFFSFSYISSNRFSSTSSI